MAATGNRAIVAMVAAVLLIVSCGGGGGSSASSLTVLSIAVLTQPPGPLSPFGTTAGGDRVQIDGSGFTGGIVVRFAGAPGAVETVVDDRVVVVTPPGSEGLVTVELQNGGGPKVTLKDAFRYVAPPTLVSVAATGGPTAGEPRAPVAGTEIEVKGAHFQNGIEVLVSGVVVTTTFVDATTVRAAAPAHVGEGNVDIGVRNPEGLAATLPLALFYTKEFSLAPEAALDKDEAEHLYRRAAFGAPLATIETAVTSGVQATVDRLVTFTNDAAVEQDALLLYDGNLPPAAAISGRMNKEWWIHLLLKNPNPFQDRLAWFLHDHFATSERNFEDSFRWTMYFQIQLFRRFSLARNSTVATGANGFGYDWKALLIEVAKDRSMLEWLNGDVSVRDAPNENFARELWELFMLGEGNGYTEKDIQEAARAFTGFFLYFQRLPSGEDILDIGYAASRHDERSKTILGATGFYGYDSISPLWVVSGPPFVTDPAMQTDPRDTGGGVIALTLKQRPVEASRHICKKLFEFFVYENPHDSVVDALASQLRAPGTRQWNLKPILETMLKSEAMYSARAMKSQIKSPVDYVIGLLRTTGILLHEDPATEIARAHLALDYIGQVPLDPPDVSGWPSGAAWTGAQPMLNRTNVVAFTATLLTDYATDITPLLPPGLPTPQALVDHIAETLDVDLSNNARTRMVEYVNSQWSNGQQVPFAYDPNDPTHVAAKTRGLLWMIAQYHDSHAR